MIVNGINLNGWNGYTDNLSRKTASAKSLFHKEVFENKDGLEGENEHKKLPLNNLEDKRNTREDSRAATQILVKPDGSRVLLVKVMAAGMQTTMSLKISEETDMPNGSIHTVEGFSEENTDTSELPNQIDNEIK